MSNPYPNKTAKSHPWRNSISAQAHAWAREESHIRNVTNVVAARPSTLSHKKELYNDTGQL